MKGNCICFEVPARKCVHPSIDHSIILCALEIIEQAEGIPITVALREEFVRQVIGQGFGGKSGNVEGDDAPPQLFASHRFDILETYEPPELSDDVLKNVRSIVKEAEGELGVDGGDE